jgi:hypothetical protein
VEQMQVLTIWIIKACLLIMYGRLTWVFIFEFLFHVACADGLSNQTTERVSSKTTWSKSLLYILPLVSLSWKSYILQYGVGPFGTTGKFPVKTVCTFPAFPLLADNWQFVCSPMLDRQKPLNHQRGFQYIFRYYDHLSANASLLAITIALEKKGDTVHYICPGYLYGKLIANIHQSLRQNQTDKLWTTDTLRNIEQVL